MLFPQVPRLRKLQRRTLWSSGEIKVTTFQLSRVSFSQGTVLYTQLQKNWRTNWLLSRLNVYLALQAKGMSCLNRGFPIIRGRFHCDRYTALKISRFLCIIFLKLIEPSEINYSFFFFNISAVWLDLGLNPKALSWIMLPSATSLCLTGYNIAKVPRGRS